MQERSSDQPPQQWSVHAQFTISHPGLDDINVSPQTHTEQTENGIQMFYTWPPKPNKNEEAQKTYTVNPTQTPHYGFQRGNLTFTSTPSKKPPIFDESKINFSSTDGANNSSHGSTFSSNTSGTNPKPQPYNRKCRSTCSIVLSTTIDERPELEEEFVESSVPRTTCCERTQSLRCQSPTSRPERPHNFYGCGDPWCYHSSYRDDTSAVNSPFHESEESCSTGQTVINKQTNSENFNLHKDAAVQTFEMVDKCTSPFLKVDPFYYNNNKQIRENLLQREKVSKKRSSYSSRRKTEPIFPRKRSPQRFTPDSLESQQLSDTSSSKLYEKSSNYSESNTIDSTTSNRATKKPRTVHIDVYCTGTEQESDETSSDTESKSSTKPETVFESSKVRVTHSRSDDKNFPKLYQQQHLLSSGASINNKLSLKTDESKSDIADNSSVGYPSQISSYSAIPELSSFSSSVPPSWSSYSMNRSVDADYDSVANTSWKDTFSDLDSLNPSRSSITQTESLDFVPKRFTPKTRSVDDIDKKNIGSSSTASLNPSDSFEYANSEDKFRIKQMERTWQHGTPKPLKFSHLDNRHLVQQQKLKEYVEKRLSGISLSKAESKESDSESDSSEKGWSFVKDDKRLHRGATIKEGTKNNSVNSSRPNSDVVEASLKLPIRSPSVAALQERLSLNPRLRAPFMVVPGIFTDQRKVAKKFGTVVDVFRKPGHHIGPAKNPVCQCDHCTSFFEGMGRNRTRSVGEIPNNNPWMNWRNAVNNNS